MNLYWVTTKEGTENWFVTAKSKKQAEFFFENAEGFDIGDSNAELISKIPKTLTTKYQITNENYAQLDLLEKLGAKIFSDTVPRIVNINGKVYTEGHLTYYYIFDSLKGVPGVYIVRIQNTNNFKIGITKNLKIRINTFSTGNPNPIKIEYFVKTKHYISLEKHLHKVFQEQRMKGEWFELNDDKFKELQAHLGVLQNHEDFFVYDVHGLYNHINYKIK